MKKNYLLLLLALYLATPLLPAEVAASKIDLSAVAKQLPHPLWALILDYYGKTTTMKCRLKFRRPAYHSHYQNELCIINEASNQRLLFSFNEIPNVMWINVSKEKRTSYSIPIPFACETNSIHLKTHEEYPMLRFPESKPTITTPDKRFEAHQFQFHPQFTTFEVIDNQGTCPIYPTLYQKLVTDQTT